MLNCVRLDISLDETAKQRVLLIHISEAVIIQEAFDHVMVFITLTA